MAPRRLASYETRPQTAPSVRWKRGKAPGRRTQPELHFSPLFLYRQPPPATEAGFSKERMILAERPAIALSYGPAVLGRFKWRETTPRRGINPDRQIWSRDVATPVWFAGREKLWSLQGKRSLRCCCAVLRGLEGDNARLKSRLFFLSYLPLRSIVLSCSRYPCLSLQVTSKRGGPRRRHFPGAIGSSK